VLKTIPGKWVTLGYAFLAQPSQGIGLTNYYVVYTYFGFNFQPFSYFLMDNGYSLKEPNP